MTGTAFKFKNSNSQSILVAICWNGMRLISVFPLIAALPKLTSSSSLPSKKAKGSMLRESAERVIVPRLLEISMVPEITISSPCGNICKSSW